MLVHHFVNHVWKYQQLGMTEQKNKVIHHSKVDVQEFGKKIIEDNKEVFDRLAESLALCDR